jgi:hypothetical protein
MTVLWLLLDLVVGVLLAGAVAPLALALMPSESRGSWVLITAAIVCVIAFSIVRRCLVTASADDQDRQ